MTNYDWCSFEKKIYINASIDRIYTCFANRKGMEEWFLRQCLYYKADGTTLEKEEFAKAGDLYTFIWHGWPDDVFEKGHILQANGEDTFEFTFNGNGSNNIKVIVSLSAENDLCCVSLKQYDIPEDEKSKTQWHIGCIEGWLFYLVNLKSVLEGGIDLRNKDLAIQGVINA